MRNLLQPNLSPVSKIGLRGMHPYILKNGRRYGETARSLFARMTSQPAAIQKELINDRIIAGESYSFWAKMDAIWVHASHDAQAARLNWLSTSYDCVTVNNPLFTAFQGYTPDGATSYLDTQFNPVTAVGANFSQDSASFGIRSNTSNQGAGSLAGFWDGSKGVTINPKDNGGTYIMRVNSGNFNAGAVASSIGLFAITRTASAVIRGYYNGGVAITGTIASLSMANGSFRLGSISNSSYRSCQFSMAFVGSGLTDQDAIDMNTWFNVYRTEIGLS